MARVRKLPRSAVAAVVGLGLVVSAALGISSVQAHADPSLPPVTARALLSSTISALHRPFSISGDVRTSVDLGLPEIPSSLDAAAGSVGITNVLSWVSGTQRFRVWRSASGVRIQHVGDLQEQDLVANAHNAWWWDSTTMTATEVRPALMEAIPSRVPAAPPGADATLENVDPTTLARRLLLAASTCGEVAVSGTTWIDGNDAYLLTFTPSSPETLVGTATVAIDATTRLPLDVQLTARGAATPAVDVGFTSVSFEPIDPSIFTFTPPPGATVRDLTGAAANALRRHASGTPQAPAEPTSVVAGSCLATSVAIELTQPLPTQASALLPYSGPLLSAVTAERGGRTWFLLGPVGVATLEHRAEALP